MADAAFSKLVPGFDFLQDLVKNAGSTLPSIGQWVAPTLNPEELDKRIQELRTVQFWLEQNASMLGATIQALEVQRMTLSTLRTMNVQMSDLRESLKIKLPEAPSAAAPSAAAGTDVAAAKKSSRRSDGADKAAGAAETGGQGTGPVDPMQWWSALTQQFADLATHAMKEGAADAAKNLAGAMQSMDAASQTLKKAAGAAAPEPKATPKRPRKRAAGPPRQGQG